MMTVVVSVSGYMQMKYFCVFVRILRNWVFSGYFWNSLDM